MSDETILSSTGIDAETGDYGLSAAVDELYELIEAELEVGDTGDEVLRRERGTLGPPATVEPDDLSDARWGIIWPPDPLTPAEKDHQRAVQDLIDHRRAQMGGVEPQQFRLQADWDFLDFLWDNNVEPGSMQPTKVPYYLLIVGSPERVGWEFQQKLDAEYAVGRLWFDDVADCESYVDHLLRYEDALRTPATGREALFVGALHPDDGPTQRSANNLVQPLHKWVHDNKKLDFATSLLLGGEAGHQASKRHVLQRLRGRSLDDTGQAPPPTLLFTAGHGVEFKQPTDRQPANQGALLFQDWPGPFTVPVAGHYLAGSDVADDAALELAGMLAFCFACFSAGTPVKQDWVKPTLLRSPATIADAPFVARLPQELLAKGMLAFIGHVSRAWAYSFLGTQGIGPQDVTFQSTVYQLLRGQPVGHATDDLNRRTLHLTDQLETQMERDDPKGDIVTTWTARNDCRGYVVLGDPAARIRVDDLPAG